MSTFLRNKAISKTRPLRKENPFPQFNVASNKRPGIGLSFEYTTTLLSGEGEEGRTGTTTMFKKRLSKYTIFSTVLSKIVCKVIRVFSQEYLQGQNKNMLIKSTLQKLFWAKSFTPDHLLIEKHDLITFFAAPSLKQSDFAIAVQRVLIVTYFPVVPEWKARKMWKVTYVFQKSLNKPCMTVLFEEKEFVVFI